MAAMTLIAPTLQELFTRRLIGERMASPHTVASYRDTFKILFTYLAGTTGKAPSQLDFEDLDAITISGFLTHLETDRGVTASTRNTRLAALRCLFKYASYNHPEHAELIARVLAIPSKRTKRPLVTFLTTREIDALLAAPDRSRWTGRRDHALLVLAIQTGLRVSEITALRSADINTNRPAHLRVFGKGRKERVTPLSKHSVVTMRAWTDERGGSQADAVFPSASEQALGRDAIRKLVVKHAHAAAAACPSLAGKQIGVHTLRHTP
jgi:site-specific recombinase XerD